MAKTQKQQEQEMDRIYKINKIKTNTEIENVVLSLI